MASRDSFFPIPFNILNQFITLANFYAQFELEIHADIYFNQAQNEYFLDVPAQAISRYRTEVTETAWSIAERVADSIKLMEIHSHHLMVAQPSDLDNLSERAPGMVYAILGETRNYFPQLYVRQFINEDKGHIIVHPNDVFETPFVKMPEFNSEGIEVF